MDTLYLVMPAYNEETNIEQTVREWLPIVEAIGGESRLVVNCSGSQDRTLTILETMKENCHRLEVLTDSPNTYRDKVLELYRYAADHKADYIFQTDSDGQTDPAEFGAFWELREKFDFLIGNRRHRQDGFSRIVVQKAETMLLNLFFHIRIPDANVPFRLMKRLPLEPYLEMLPTDYPMPNILLTALFAAGGEAVLFCDISFADRRSGKNTMNLRSIFRIGLASLSAFHSLSKKIRVRQKK